MSSSFEGWIVNTADAIIDVASLFGLDTLASDILTLGAKRINPSDVTRVINAIIDKAPANATAAINRLDNILNGLQPYISSTAYKSAMNNLATKVQTARNRATDLMSKAERYVSEAENDTYLINNETNANRRDLVGSRASALRDSATKSARKANETYNQITNLVEETIKEI